MISWASVDGISMACGMEGEGGGPKDAAGPSTATGKGMDGGTLSISTVSPSLPFIKMSLCPSKMRPPPSAFSEGLIAREALTSGTMDE